VQRSNDEDKERSDVEHEVESPPQARPAGAGRRPDGHRRGPGPGRAAGTEIGVIDVERLVKGSVAGKAALELQKAQEAKATSCAPSSGAGGPAAEAEAGRMSLALDKISAMEKARGPVAAAKHFQEDAERELQRQRDEAFAGIRRVLPIIDQWARSRASPSCSTSSRRPLFVNEQNDITQLIIQRFDALPRARPASSMLRLGELAIAGGEARGDRERPIAGLAGLESAG
jgi:hypothetical protein